MKKVTIALAMIAMMYGVPAQAQYAAYESTQAQLPPVQVQTPPQRDYRSRISPSSVSAQPYSSGGASDTAGMDARMSQLEEQIRRLNGTLEELQYKLNTMQTSRQQYEDNLDRKLSLLEQKTAAAPSIAANGGEAMAATAPAAGKAAVPAKNTAPVAPPAGTPDNPRDHYNQAFQLLNQANFKDARTSLESFVQKYPDDPLTGNAYYWLGETYYAGRNYATAADNFRKGYEKLPTGPKAADNLLKLGMSLQAMGKGTEACVVYDQIFLQFPNVGSSVRQKVEQEKSQAQCKKKS
jgi:tol-pal system protein YbgF